MFCTVRISDTYSIYTKILYKHTHVNAVYNPICPRGKSVPKEYELLLNQYTILHPWRRLSLH